MKNPGAHSRRRTHWTHKSTSGHREPRSFKPKREKQFSIEPEHRWHWSDSVTLLRVEAKLAEIGQRFGLLPSPVERLKPL